MRIKTQLLRWFTQKNLNGCVNPSKRTAVKIVWPRVIVHIDNVYAVSLFYGPRHISRYRFTTDQLYPFPMQAINQLKFGC